MKLFLANCIDAMKSLPKNSVDAIVTDPPYGLSFMGKNWDYDVPTEEIWREALRVLKPGGHLLSFFGTRTYHRGVVRIEDAGFEIRDQIMWIYGSGFPKSHNIDKAIDKMLGAEREIVGINPSSRPNSKMKGSKGFDGDLESDESAGFQSITAPSSDQAKQWQGWGTALKPANEPIVVARKPLEKGLTVAENVLKWGTGAINIDESRISTDGEVVWKVKESDKISDSLMCFDKPGAGSDSMFKNKGGREGTALGRWPANILFDEDAASMLGEPSRFFYVAKASKSERNAGLEGMPEKLNDFQRQSSGLSTTTIDGIRQKGNCGQPNQNHHPTVKPIKLMQYLIKLVTPPNGTVLDPFMGSGSTGVAAKNLGVNFIGCEMNEEYFEIAKKRIGV